MERSIEVATTPLFKETVRIVTDQLSFLSAYHCMEKTIPVQSISWLGYIEDWFFDLLTKEIQKIGQDRNSFRYQGPQNSVKNSRRRKGVCCRFKLIPV